MLALREPNPVTNSIVATVFFTKPDKPAGYGHGFVIRFSVAPKVGDPLTVDQYSIRKIPQEELHETRWHVAAVEHDLNLDSEDEREYPLATLRVTVHPGH